MFLCDARDDPIRDQYDLRTAAATTSTPCSAAATRSRRVTDALVAAGKRVPDDVAIVGFDNWDVMVQARRTPLTSVDMEREKLGRTAASLLLAAINGDPSPGRHTNPCRLVVRESTAVPITPSVRS